MCVCVCVCVCAAPSFPADLGTEPEEDGSGLLQLVGDVARVDEVPDEVLESRVFLHGHLKQSLPVMQKWGAGVFARTVGKESY